jgi:hypothetical protein
MRHEPGDENYRTILTTAGILAASIAVVLFVAYGLLLYFGNRENREKKAEFPLAAEVNRLPLSERLQQTARSQPLLEGFKRQEGQEMEVGPRENRLPGHERLQSYGPADPPEKGFTRIPIDVAMRRMLEKDRLPVQKGDVRDKQEKKRP